MSDGGKGSKRRPSLITDQRLLDNWDRIFNKDKEDDTTKPEGTTDYKKNLQQAKKRRRITARVVGRNRR